MLPYLLNYILRSQVRFIFVGRIVLIIFATILVCILVCICVFTFVSTFVSVFVSKGVRLLFSFSRRRRCQPCGWSWQRWWWHGLCGGRGSWRISLKLTVLRRHRGSWKISPKLTVLRRRRGSWRISPKL